jgi:hypothetical protein
MTSDSELRMVALAESFAEADAEMRESSRVLTAAENRNELARKAVSDLTNQLGQFVGNNVRSKVIRVSATQVVTVRHVEPRNVAVAVETLVYRD